MANIKVAYCTGFWCTNIGNGFFSIGVEYVLKKLLGDENVTVISDYQTYTTVYGKRLFPDKNQLEYISKLDVDYVILAGPVISRYFLILWENILLELKDRGIRYILLSAGTMKMDESSRDKCKIFFQKCPPYAFSSRDQKAYDEYGVYATKKYNGICFSFFLSDAYSPLGLTSIQPYVILNFDKIGEPRIWRHDGSDKRYRKSFQYNNQEYRIAHQKFLASLSARTDRFTDALIYAISLLPAGKINNMIGEYRVIRTDHRFYPHYRSKIYRQKNSYCADLPYGYLSLYANAEFTLSDRIHACAATLAFGNSAMLFAKTDRQGLLERVGADNICERPVRLDMDRLSCEKQALIEWLQGVFSGE